MTGAYGGGVSLYNRVREQLRLPSRCLCACGDIIPHDLWGLLDNLLDICNTPVSSHCSLDTTISGI